MAMFALNTEGMFYTVKGGFCTGDIKEADDITDLDKEPFMMDSIFIVTDVLNPTEVYEVAKVTGNWELLYADGDDLGKNICDVCSDPGVVVYMIEVFLPTGDTTQGVQLQVCRAHFDELAKARRPEEETYE